MTTAKLANMPRSQNTEIKVISTSITDFAPRIDALGLIHICRTSSLKGAPPPAGNLLAAKHVERTASQRNKYLIHFSFPTYGAHFMSR